MKVYIILIFCISRAFLSLFIDIKLNPLVRLHTSFYFISQCIVRDKKIRPYGFIIRETNTGVKVHDFIMIFGRTM